MTRFINGVSWQPENQINSLTFKKTNIASLLSDL